MTARAVAVAAVVVAGFAGCSSSGARDEAPKLERAALLDAKTCASCHGDHYREWSGSMHAYASDDPVFRAMNARAQRETNGAIGSFCVNCHAPLAVRENATKDGLNLDQVDAKLKGVTCFFCHQVDEIQGTHNAELGLANDLVMRGRYADPVANTAHRAQYSSLQDGTNGDSARACGACHDIENGHGLSVERTLQEWQASAFSVPPNGLSCAQCHMPATPRVPIAQAPNVYLRERHAHAFEAVDVATTPFPETADQKARIDALLGTELAVALCVQLVGERGAAQVVVDNAGAGHAFPSGSAMDRRLWFEVQAFKDGAPIFQSGVVPADTSVTALVDPSLWLLRDRIFDDTNREVHLFFEAARYESRVLAAKPPPAPLRSTHLLRRYPLDPDTLFAAKPDRVTVRALLQPIGLDILDDLVASGDLSPALRQAAPPPHQVGATLEWTAAAAAIAGIPFSARNEAPGTCVSTVADLGTSLNLVQANCSADDPTRCSF